MPGATSSEIMTTIIIKYGPWKLCGHWDSRYYRQFLGIHINIFTCLFSVHNAISLSLHAQVKISWKKKKEFFLIENLADVNVHVKKNLFFWIILKSVFIYFCQH